MGLLPEVDFQSPFFPRLVFINFGWEEAFELSAKDDHCWAEAMERVGSVMVLQEGSGELVGVKGAAGSQVSCDEPFGGFYCEFGPFVDFRIVGR